ncbi:CST complex subunit Ten1 [Terfezia claveryi]|nr:CST complex subunit Ten1 [Terfezia claveryi]
MSYGPNPASLTLLEALQRFPARSKVRFLGCIISYHSPSATLTVSHKSLYPSSCQPKTQEAKVDISNLVRTLSTDVLQNGEWINIIGYTVKAGMSGTENTQGGVEVVYIDAVQIWSAGAIDLGGYERSLREKLEVDQRSVNMIGTSTRA